MNENMIDESVVFFAYKILLDREPDPEGLQHWLRRGQAEQFSAWDLGQALMYSQEHIDRRYPPFTCIDYRNIKLFLDPNDASLGRPLIAGSEHEPWVTRELAALLAPGDTFMDIGACIGIHALVAAKIVGPAGKVIAIEPNHRNCTALRRSVAANNFKNFEIHPIAAWNSREYLSLFSRGHNGHAHQIDETGLQVIQAEPLDRLFSKDVAPKVVKIDVEGNEPRVINGARRMIETADAVFLEWSPRLLKDRGFENPIDILVQLSELGFDKFTVLENNPGIVAKLSKPKEVKELFDKQVGIQLFDLLVEK